MTKHSAIDPLLELWAGVECTINRVGDTFFDQLEWSGHTQRLDDLDRFAALGIRALRYPIQWERTAPGGLAQADWSWADSRLSRLQELGIRPIVGLVHHGSGPSTTNLLDPAFPDRLAQFARAVAERYPWITDYIPVNEPLTTARFSGLYGHWYPHGRDDQTFARALITQCRAIVLAMQAIRAVNGAARLIQTEDIGKVFSTPVLAYQTDFENTRRWLSFDLLCGRVDRAHPMWGYLCQAGIGESELGWFIEHPCPPDILGINSYLTSERFLDHRLERYPRQTHGGNGRHTYADVAAVHVRKHGLVGHRTLLDEAWQRYELPLAVTEAHNGCTREEQLRWFQEVWEAARDRRAAGVDVRAVTAWALLGAYEWNSLVTRQANHYEPGLFDVRGPQPRRTALAKLARDLAAGRTPDHPVLAAPGWWRRPHRFFFGDDLDPGAAEPPADASRNCKSPITHEPRPILIVGAGGTLGRAFIRLCDLRGLPYQARTRQELDIADPAQVGAELERVRPWTVVNAAGYVHVDQAECEPKQCFQANASGAAVLAVACAERGARLLIFSTDLVFDGQQQVPYVERDTPAPLNVYGRSKLEAERRVLAALPAALVVRTSAFFGPWDEYNFITLMLRTLAAGQRFAAAVDTVVSPTYVPDLVHACLDLLIDGETGIWHLANSGAVSWADLARLVARRVGWGAGLIDGVPIAALDLPAPRPRYSALGSARGTLLPALEDAIDRYLQEREVVERERAVGSS